MSVQSMIRKFGGIAAITLTAILGSLSLPAQTPEPENISAVSYSQSGSQAASTRTDAAALETDAGAILSWQLDPDMPTTWEVHVLLVGLTLASLFLGYALLTTIRIANGQRWATRQRTSVRFPKLT